MVSYFGGLPLLWGGALSIITGSLFILISHYWYKFISKVKLDIKELTCWHIEREEPPTHAFPHCHEYNFAGEILITPRTKTVVKAFYLNLPIKKEVLRADSLPLPPVFDLYGNITSSGLTKITPDSQIIRTFTFQIRLKRGIHVPSCGYVVLEFEGGKVRSKVNIKLDDEYIDRSNRE